MTATEPDTVAVDVHHDARTGTYRVVLDGMIEASSTVVMAVAAVLDRDVTELDPLDDAVDPDALDALFVPKPDGTERGGGELSFRFGGCTVTVASRGEIVVDPDG